MPNVCILFAVSCGIPDFGPNIGVKRWSSVTNVKFLPYKYEWNLFMPYTIASAMMMGFGVQCYFSGLRVSARPCAWSLQTA